ncbi:CBS domain-containing protein [Alteromonas sp. 5E99-2]|uniref:CBS domain-containing protein n=1 Tax=Alteromonas sp. 5E99-2 TaxID=2817683 RepID=UPI001A9A1A7D|nr:CBS domain-containing protein [Alteromonas sp. 5E99-2]MBO1254937.1 CBS domain-containing protein [Alteromonas sp. 5E99-2]
MESLEIQKYMNARPVKLDVKMTVAEAVDLLLSRKQTGGPVVDYNNKVVGFLSEQDCIKHMIDSSYYREQICRVEDIMVRPVVSVKAYNSVLELAQTMIREKPKVYPVVDDDGYLVGAIDRSAVLAALNKHFDSGFS